MQIQTGEAWNLEYITRQDLAVGSDHNQIGHKATDVFDGLWIFDFRRLKNFKERWLPGPKCFRDLETAALCYLLFYLRRFNSLLALDRLICLSDHTDDFVFTLQQRVHVRLAKN